MVQGTGRASGFRGERALPTGLEEVEKRRVQMLSNNWQVEGEVNI